jgi:pantetheine-phosphate adenylyltransferase
MSSSDRPVPRVAVFPGSFDPITNGHVDIIERGTRLFDRIVVAVLVNETKTPLFTPAERVAMIRAVFADHPAVEVETFDGLLVDYARGRGANAIVKGLRAVADFEYESQMALMNRRLAGDVDTVFLMPAERFAYTSSRLIKEVVRLGGDVHGLVPALVEDRLRNKFALLRDPLNAPRQV